MPKRPDAGRDGGGAHVPGAGSDRSSSARSAAGRASDIRSEESSSSRLGTPSQAPGTEASWDASHRRVTFYCPDDVLEAIHTDMARSGRSKTRVIVDALRAHLPLR
jgi:hypothetical protein